MSCRTASIGSLVRARPHLAQYVGRVTATADCSGRLWRAKLGANARLMFLPDVNHARKQGEPSDRANNIAAYADPNRPNAPGVIDAIALVIRANRAGATQGR